MLTTQSFSLNIVSLCKYQSCQLLIHLTFIATLQNLDFSLLINITRRESNLSKVIYLLGSTVMLQIQVDLHEIQMCVLSVHHSEMPSLTECSHINTKIRQIVSMCAYEQEITREEQPFSSSTVCIRWHRGAGKIQLLS